MISVRRPALSRVAMPLIAALVLAAGSVPRTAGASPSTAPAAKKVCKTVKKHGKKTKVCHKVKAHPTPTPTPKPLTYDVVADRLATEVSSASSDDARYQALLDVMKALHVGVYSSSGTSIVPSTVEGLYLTDMELKAMAGQIGRGTTVGTAEIAAMLNGIGSMPNNAPLDTGTLRHILLSGVQTAASTPSAYPSVVPLLVRDLGMHHATAYDMTQDVPDAALRFDSLQTYLITADILLPVLANAPDTASLHDAVSLRPLMRAHDDGGPCDSKDSAETKLLKEAINDAVIPFVTWGAAALAAKYIAQKVRDLATKAKTAASAALSLALQVLDEEVAGEMLAYSVDVSAASPDLQTTHYGPAGHATNAGNPIRFTVKVIMKDDYGEGVISCGPLAGVKIPPMGGIKGVTVLWSTSEGYEQLKRHGTITYDPADQTTAADGSATLIFTPKDESVPGLGLRIVDHGSVTGLARYQAAFESGGPLMVNRAADFLFPKYAVMGWEVERHAPRGFKFKISANFGNTSQAPDDLFDENIFEGHICGEDPFTPTDPATDPSSAHGWQLHIKEITGSTAHGDHTHVDQDVTVTAYYKPPKQGGTVWPIGPGVTHELEGFSTTGHIVFHPELKQVWVVVDHPDPTLSPGPNVFKAPLEEDTSCPEPNSTP